MGFISRIVNRLRARKGSRLDRRSVFTKEKSGIAFIGPKGASIKPRFPHLHGRRTKRGYQYTTGTRKTDRKIE